MTAMTGVTPDSILGRIGIKGTRYQCNNPDHHPDGVAIKDWCDHIQMMIYRGEDAVLLHPTMTVEIPVFPTEDAYAQVTIGDPQVEGASFALMWMDYTPDVGRPKKIPLGFWNDGEGALSIRTVILDYLRANLHQGEDWTTNGSKIVSKCPSGSQHGMDKQRMMQIRAQADPNWRFKCLWNIVLEGCCTLCYEETAGLGDDNFGITPESVKTGARPSSSKPWTPPPASSPLPF